MAFLAICAGGPYCERRSFPTRTFMIAAALVLAASVTANAQLSNADCLTCHDKVRPSNSPVLSTGRSGVRTVTPALPVPARTIRRRSPSTAAAGLYAADRAAVYKAKCAGCHGADGSGQTAMGKAMKLRDLGSAE